MSDEPKPSARAMADKPSKRILVAAHAITSIGTKDPAALVALLESHFRAHDELLAACKLVIDTAGVWRPNLASLIPEATLEEVSKALALAEPEQKENER